MTVTIGSTSTGVTFTTLLAQPFAYFGDATDGLTARSWEVRGLLSSADWQTLLGVYEGWRADRINDPDTLAAESVGTTIDFAASANGATVTGLPVWFVDPPSGEQAGNYISASFSVVDAAQALEVLLKRREKERSAEDKPDLGVYELGGAEITLLQPPETFTNGPQVGRTVSGASYITGGLNATEVRNIVGTTDATGWAAILDWYAEIVETYPQVGTWFPLTPPQATAENSVLEGVKFIEYTVQISIAKIR